MTDFKESEKIAGEIAANIEAIKDWIFLALRAPRTGNNELSKDPLNIQFLRNEIIEVTEGVIFWINSQEKDSKAIFPMLRRLNEIAYYFAERGVDKEAKINNSHELMGSVLQMHDVDYLFFVGYEDRENMVTSEREITMVKNRGEDVKRSIITDYDKDRHMIYYKREGGSLGQAHNKSEKWAGKIRK